ncbi:MAG: hypothetical protein HY000_23610, partial [Planctomycetes bacterium]|nr:hypothetical protein [Planctomycetota bacterium]
RKQKLIEELQERGIAQAEMRVLIQEPQPAAPIPPANQPAAAAVAPAVTAVAPRSLPGEFWVYVTPEFLYGGVK